MSQTPLAETLELLSIETEPGVRYSFDNTYIVDPIVIENDPFILARLDRKVFVTEMTPIVKAYNQMVMADGKIAAKVDFDDSVIDSNDWKMPEEYKRMTLKDISCRMLDRQEELQLDDDLYDVRLLRMKQELIAFKEIGKLDMIRLMCYIVDTMTAAKQIWGVGRGSSVSSYVLFLIGVHDIDSVKYDLDFTDFVKPQELP